MQSEPATVMYLVRQVGANRWEVNRSGLDKPVASFPDKEGAVEFAERMSVATGKPAARNYH